MGAKSNLALLKSLQLLRFLGLFSSIIILPRLEAAMPVPYTVDKQTDWQNQLTILLQNGNAVRATNFNTFTYNEQAIIPLQGDRDGLDIAVRRTQALVNDLKSQGSNATLDALEAEFTALKQECTNAPITDVTLRGTLYTKVCDVRRRIAFSNPLLANMNEIVFVKRGGSFGHICDQFFGMNLQSGGGLFSLVNPFSANPSIKNILAGVTVQNGKFAGKAISNFGAFLSPEVSFDGKTIMFAWSEKKGKAWTDSSCLHIFKIDANGTNLTQLTSGAYDDFDPCFLPSGRVAFISTRRGGYGRCHPRPVPTYALCSMKPDGSDIFLLSYHETNEWNPSVDNAGRIVYSRWDYVDRGDMIAHNLWICGPDGTDPRAPHGNYPAKQRNLPMSEVNIRAIPNTNGVYVATSSAHHGESYGTLVVINTQIADDGNISQLKVLTPTHGMPEGYGGGSSPSQSSFATAWPLSNKYFLCALALKNNRHGIYLLDCYGNLELLYSDPTFKCIDPIPLMSRPMPPKIASKTNQGVDAIKGTAAPRATVSISNIYVSDFAWPANTDIKELRIIQVEPKPTPQAELPKVSYALEVNARMPLGTVPVESDGSVYFEAPVGKCIYFQALDSKGMAVQSMMSATYVHPGEQMSCLGCHESKWEAIPPMNQRIAFQRAPSKIKPEVCGLEPLSYPRHVQPIFENKCAKCHKERGKGPDLGDRTRVQTAGRYGDVSYWFKSYTTVKNYSWYSNCTDTRSKAGSIGARGSRLILPDNAKRWNGAALDSGHFGTSLTQQERRMITLWLDLGSPFFGSELDPESQLLGEAPKMPYDFDPANPLGTEWSGSVGINNYYNVNQSKNSRILQNIIIDGNVQKRLIGNATSDYYDIYGRVIHFNKNSKKHKKIAHGLFITK